MTLHVCILGIDGSGKSTVATALPPLLAAETRLVVGSASESFQILAPAEDHLASNFCPDGLPLMARLSIRLKRVAKRFVDQPSLYPAFKLAQMLAQDSAARVLAKRYSPAVFVSDGNAFLSTTGRAANYLRAASRRQHTDAPAVDEADLRAVFSYVLNGVPVPKESKQKLPPLWRGKLLYKLNNLLRLHAVWLPDVVVFLDLSPAVALTRIKSRRRKIDRHENMADLVQASEMYRKTVKAFQNYRSSEAVHCLLIDDLPVGATIEAVIEALKPHLRSSGALVQRSGAPLGTSQLGDSVIRERTFSHRYLLSYLLPKWFRGAWREPAFFLSQLGRLFLKEGYSAKVMRAIYDQDEKRYGLLDRIFLEYSLHRAVYDRLQILVRKIKPVLEARVFSGREVNILTAPSGFAYDLFKPLEEIARQNADAMKLVHVVAADLDPHSYLQDSLSDRARRLGIRFTFVRGDITNQSIRSRLEESAPFDLSLFVGLSSWLPKPDTVAHLSWLRETMVPGGLLITDSFTPDAYALSGRYIGYKANYYTPEVYKAMIDYSGFDGLNADLESGRDRINHVLFAAPRMSRKMHDRAPGMVFTQAS